VPGQDGPQIEEDEMHPDITQSLAAERIREWRDRAARDQLMKEARRARHEAPASAAGLLRLRAGSARRGQATAAGKRAVAADHRSPWRRAA
jgi:hypothetical protein